MTFIDNATAAIDRVGSLPIGIVLGLATADWKDDRERDSFLDALTRGGEQ